MEARRTMPASNNQVSRYKKFITVEDKDEIVIISNSLHALQPSGLNGYEVNLNLPRWLQFTSISPTTSITLLLMFLLWSLQTKNTSLQHGVTNNRLTILINYILLQKVKPFCFDNQISSKSTGIVFISVIILLPFEN